MELALNNLQRLICHKTHQTKPESLFSSFFLSFKRPIITFDRTILKIINNFSKRAIYGKPSTFGSYPNHYQGKVYLS